MTKEKTNNILVVDDEPANLGILFDYLSSLNFTVFLAESCVDAMQVIKSFKPDLILLDINMPELNGFETCELLKKNSDTADIPIIFLTARNDTIDKVRGFALGAVDYITKPIEVEEVSMRINIHLKTHHQIQYLSAQVQEKEKKVICSALQYGLNHRETKVLELFSLAYKRTDIAQQLNITENTLKWYLKIIYSKLGVNNRAEAIAKAREIGL